MVIEVLRSPNNTKTPTKPVSGNIYETGECSRNSSKVKPKGQRDVEQSSLLTSVPANTHSSQGESQLYNFEDNEAVIKMIIKGRCDMCQELTGFQLIGCLTGLNVEPRIQIKYVDAKNHFAEKLSQRSFTRNEWNHLLHLLNIMNFSVFFLQPFLSFKLKAKRTECYAQKKTRRIFRRKFTYREVQICEFGDGKTRIFFPWCRATCRAISLCET